MHISGKMIGIGLAATVATVLIVKKVKEGSVPASGQTAIPAPTPGKWGMTWTTSAADASMRAAARRRV